MKLLISAICEKCGAFEVTRKKVKRRNSMDQEYDTPGSVVCPGCRMWATITEVKEV